ncbi:M1 family metallopeptidase [Jiulongibacter sediminis]|uniref:Peptidase M1 n=1 Tax=Jiulongibacter sediminis TaxID=1605367 RepID=A0A0P7BWX8_9BACT|nr:M1 family metallopeptidase [Jiulongibacter sediminis]KPM49112.1 peptidase M1 [Jiulongibacter sediminis]TBX26170.1 peptidase M1 [Jiulongibacter sediminis]
MKKEAFITLVLLVFTSQVFSQYTKDDSLMGVITPERTWWDLKYYDLDVEVDIENKFFKGSNVILFQALEEGSVMQIDLQPPMKITDVSQADLVLKFNKVAKNTYHIFFNEPIVKGQLSAIKIYFEGQPHEAKNAPWDGGVVFTRDSNGKPFVATANQGIGASIWWPCKDHPADEVDSLQIRVTVPDELWNISNGQMRDMQLSGDGKRSTTWFVNNPINNYGVNINIGNYVSWKDVYQGEKGPLDVSFYVLEQDLPKAKAQFTDAYRTLEALEHWFGPYPFYEDGYKLVQVPYLGMEHQSSVTYGNGFSNGYKGTDLSGTGWGLKWDFIIVHESGHEWFANNITNKDKADMWIHEGFTNYSENLFTEYFYGKEAGAEYVRGTRRLIQNDRPIIGDYKVSQSGSSDMYYKGGNMLHTIRQIINDDEKWRSILRGLNKDFYHQTVTTAQVENYISEKSGIDLSKVFDQYLRTTKIPKLVLTQKGKKIKYHWENVVSGFSMPVDIKVNGETKRICPTRKPQKIKVSGLIVDEDFYIETSWRSEG